MDNQYDIIIIGTGSGGSTIAYKLAKTGKRILILERGGFIPKEKEILTTDQCFNEIVMTGLRTADGISIERIDNLGGNYAESLLINLEPYLQSEKIFQLPGGNYALKPEQYFFADGIASDLFLVP